MSCSSESWIRSSCWLVVCGDLTCVALAAGRLSHPVLILAQSALLTRASAVAGRESARGAGTAAAESSRSELTCTAASVQHTQRPER